MRKSRRFVPALLGLVVCVVLIHLCCVGEWVCEPMEVPATRSLIVKGDIANLGEAFLAMVGRDMRKFMPTQWIMSLVIGNSTNTSVNLSLSESAIVTPQRRSYPLNGLVEKLPSSIPPGTAIDDLFSLPSMALSSGDIVSLYLVWYDATGRHGEYWTWTMRQVPDMVKKTTSPKPVPQQRSPRRSQPKINWWFVLLILLGLACIGYAVTPPGYR